MQNETINPHSEVEEEGGAITMELETSAAANLEAAMRVAGDVLYTNHPVFGDLGEGKKKFFEEVGGTVSPEYLRQVAAFPSTMQAQVLTMHREGVGNDDIIRKTGLSHYSVRGSIMLARRIGLLPRNVNHKGNYQALMAYMAGKKSAKINAMNNPDPRLVDKAAKLKARETRDKAIEAYRVAMRDAAPEAQNDSGFGKRGFPRKNFEKMVKAGLFKMPDELEPAHPLPAPTLPVVPTPSPSPSPVAIQTSTPGAIDLHLKLSPDEISLVFNALSEARRKA